MNAKQLCYRRGLICQKGRGKEMQFQNERDIDDPGRVLETTVVDCAPGKGGCEASQRSCCLTSLHHEKLVEQKDMPKNLSTDT